MKKITFDLHIGNEVYKNCFFVYNRYANNNNLALDIYNNDGLFDECVCRVTMNTFMLMDDDVIPVKDYSENEGLADALESLGFIEKTNQYTTSGFINVPIYAITEYGHKAIFGDNE